MFISIGKSTKHTYNMHNIGQGNCSPAHDSHPGSTMCTSEVGPDAQIDARFSREPCAGEYLPIGQYIVH